MPTAFEHALTATIGPLEGWCSAAKACAIANYVVTERLSSALEIGVFGGKSLLAIAMAQVHAELDTAITVGIDSWRAEDCVEGEPHPANVEWWSNRDMLHEVHRKCMEAIWSTGLAERILVFRNNSSAVASFLHDREWDLIHIDGNHSELASTRDVALWLPRLRSGGILIFDDLDWSNEGGAVKQLDQDCERIQTLANCAFYRKPHAGQTSVSSAQAAPPTRKPAPKRKPKRLTSTPVAATLP